MCLQSGQHKAFAPSPIPPSLAYHAERESPCVMIRPSNHPPGFGRGWRLVGWCGRWWVVVWTVVRRRPGTRTPRGFVAGTDTRTHNGLRPKECLCMQTDKRSGDPLRWPSQRAKGGSQRRDVMPWAGGDR